MKSEEDIRAVIARFQEQRDKHLEKMKEHDWILGRRKEVYWAALTGYIEMIHKINALKWVLGEESEKVEPYNRYWASKSK